MPATSRRASPTTFSGSQGPAPTRNPWSRTPPAEASDSASRSGPPPGVARHAPFSTRRSRVMGHADRSSRSVILKAEADRFAVDLILDCERAASRRNPRDCDPTRWSKTAWRRYLYAAAHAPSLVDLERVFGR